jgi:transposase InsO family protein
MIRGKPHRTTFSEKAAPCPLDRVKRNFKAPAPNTLWVSDFTYGAPRAHMTGMQRRKEEVNECLALCCEGA